MKLKMIIFLLWPFVYKSTIYSLYNCADRIMEDFTNYAKKGVVNIANTACHTLAYAVREHSFKAPHIEKVAFQLRTPCKHIMVRANEIDKLRQIPEFDVNGKTVVFVTGWLIPLDKYFIADMARAYHCRGGHNFLVFDSGGFIVNEYFSSAYHTAKLGEFLAKGLYKLAIPTENIHLIGHSLGAHIVGSAGRHFYRLTGQKLRRITGLDPARPCFENPVTFSRLSRDDAAFVDIVHSDPAFLGTVQPTGDSDFYAGGLDDLKPGCGKISVRCSHELSIQYYLESVYPGNEKNLMGAHCSNYTSLEKKACAGPKYPMGYAADRSVPGIYYLPVRSESPYGVDATSGDNFRNGECGRCSQ